MKVNQTNKFMNLTNHKKANTLDRTTRTHMHANAHAHAHTHMRVCTHTHTHIPMHIHSLPGYLNVPLVVSTAVSRGWEVVVSTAVVA